MSNGPAEGQPPPPIDAHFEEVDAKPKFKFKAIHLAVLGTFAAFAGVGAIALKMNEGHERPAHSGEADTRNPGPTAPGETTPDADAIQRSNYEILEANVSARIELPTNIPPNTRVVVSLIFATEGDTSIRGCEGMTCRTLDNFIPLVARATDATDLTGIVLAEVTTDAQGRATVEVPTTIKIGGKEIELAQAGYFVGSDPIGLENPEGRIEYVAPGVEHFAFGAAPTPAPAPEPVAAPRPAPSAAGTRPYNPVEPASGPEGEELAGGPQ